MSIKVFRIKPTKLCLIINNYLTFPLLYYWSLGTNWMCNIRIKNNMMTLMEEINL